MVEAANELRPSRESKGFRRLFLLVAILGCLVAMSPDTADPDLWGHVTYGRDLLATGELAPTTTYSYSANGYRWINHENLSEILFAAGVDSIGPQGLLIAKCLLGFALLWLVARHAFARGANLLTVCLVIALMALNLGFYWTMRPQLTTYAYFTLLVLLLSYCFRGWEGRGRLPWRVRGAGGLKRPKLRYDLQRLRYLWLAPVLFLFWANSHGAFVAGVCIYIAYLGCRSIEALACQGREAWGLVRRFTLMAVVAVLATMINPYGIDLHLWLLKSLGVPRPEITEWRAPNLFTLDALRCWLLLGTFIMAITFSRRQRDFTQLVLLAVTLWQSLEHVRHFPFFIILFGFWMPVHIQSVFRRWRLGTDEEQKAASMSPFIRNALATGMCALLAFFGYRLYDHARVMRVQKHLFPVDAMQFMADHDMQGRLTVTYNWAQYAIAAFGAEKEGQAPLLVGFDGRFRTCYPQEIVDMNFDLVLGDGDSSRRYRSPNSGDFQPTRVLEFKQPNLVLIDRGQPHSERVMEASQDQWVLLYQDALAQVWGRRSIYDTPDQPTYIAPEDRRISDQRKTGTLPWPAFPTKRQA